MRILNLLIFIIIIFCFLSLVESKGDLTKQKPIEVKVFLKGEKNERYFFEPSELKFQTGKLYSLEIINISDSKHYFTSHGFARSIFTRKIQISFKGNKIAEIKGKINEVEIFPANSLEWWFVPIKTGYFDDLVCDIIEKDVNLKHSQMGMTGVIIIE